MGISESKRQQQLAKKKKKRKAKLATSTSKLGKAANQLRMAQQAAALPIQDCLLPEEIFEESGIGSVVISRIKENGNVAVSVILLDVYCLGAKNALFHVLPPADYQELLRHIGTHETLKPAPPACARKLVEDCIGYARDLGFEPHADYEIARQLFGDIEAGDCTETYEFGKDGKPFYVAGPNDSAKKMARIVETLSKNCGEGNFNYLLGFS